MERTLLRSGLYLVLALTALWLIVAFLSGPWAYKGYELAGGLLILVVALAGIASTVKVTA